VSGFDFGYNSDPISHDQDSPSSSDDTLDEDATGMPEREAVDEEEDRRLTLEDEEEMLSDGSEDDDVPPGTDADGFLYDRCSGLSLQNSP
jgi:hypothetical protein